MKNFFFVPLLIVAAIVSGCSSGENREVVAPPKVPNDPKMSADAKTATQTGINNASIEQKIHETGMTPDGRHVPHG